jgi:hypothetical protein
MKFVSSLIATLLLASPPSFAGGDQDAVVDVLKTVTRAIEAHDLAATDPLWVTDATFSVIDNGEVSYEGWKSFRARVLTPELEPMKDMRFDLLNVRPHVVDKLAWITYEYRITANVKERPMVSEGAATMVLTRTANNWIVAHVNIASKRPAEPQNASAGHMH